MNIDRPSITHDLPTEHVAGFVVLPSTGFIVKVYAKSEDGYWTNARLIAAAPDMLETGRPIRDFIAAHDRENEGRTNDNHIVIGSLSNNVITIGMLRAFAAAIAKAEGRE